jgi:hypothetical protein
MGNKTLSPWVWLVFGSLKFTCKKVLGIKVCPEKILFPDFLEEGYKIFGTILFLVKRA